MYVDELTSGTNGWISPQRHECKNGGPGAVARTTEQKIWHLVELEEQCKGIYINEVINGCVSPQRAKGDLEGQEQI